MRCTSRLILAAKGASVVRFPYLFAFLKKADEEKDESAVEEIHERRDKYARIMQALKEKTDITIFSGGTDYNKLWDVLDFTVEGLLERNIRNGSFRADLFMAEATEYVDMIQKMVLT